MLHKWKLYLKNIQFNLTEETNWKEPAGIVERQTHISSSQVITVPKNSSSEIKGKKDDKNTRDSFALKSCFQFWVEWLTSYSDEWGDMQSSDSTSSEFPLLIWMFKWSRLVIYILFCNHNYLGLLVF